MIMKETLIKGLYREINILILPLLRKHKKHRETLIRTGEIIVTWFYRTTTWRLLGKELVKRKQLINGMEFRAQGC